MGKVNALDEARQAIGQLSLKIGTWLAEMDGDTNAKMILLDDVRQLKKDLAAVEWDVEKICAESMDQKLFIGDGLTATRSRYSRTTWDTRKLAGDMVEPLCINSDGEVIHDPALAWSMLDALLGAAHIDYWRVTELTKAGIDPDQYRDREWGRWTVRVDRSQSPLGDL